MDFQLKWYEYLLLPVVGGILLIGYCYSLLTVAATFAAVIVASLTYLIGVNNKRLNIRRAFFHEMYAIGEALNQFYDEFENEANLPPGNNISKDLRHTHLPNEIFIQNAGNLGWLTEGETRHIIIFYSYLRGLQEQFDDIAGRKITKKEREQIEGVMEDAVDHWKYAMKKFHDKIDISEELEFDPDGCPKLPNNSSND